MARLSDNTIEAILERMGTSYRSWVPCQERKSATWDFLVQELNEKNSIAVHTSVPLWTSVINLFRVQVLVPVFSVLAVALISAGTLFSAAEASLPGDSLYTIKLVRERAQIRLTKDGADRSAFSVGLATKRANEMQAVVTSNEPKEMKSERLKLAVAGLHSSVGEATDTLTRTTEKKDFAAVIERETANVAEVLTETKERATADNGEVAATVNAALAYVTETNEAVRIAAHPPTEFASSIVARVATLSGPNEVTTNTQATQEREVRRTYQTPATIVPPQSVFARPMGVSVNSPMNLPMATSIYGELPFAASVQSNPGF